MNTDAVSEKVRAFYEQHPYPPPVDDLEGYRRLWQDRRRRRAEHHLFWPGRPYRENASILVAGCGTSQAAKHALRWPAARVTAIDFSATSVQQTEALKRRHGLDNLTVRQLPVERTSELRDTFDWIVCTGVLHHLADPAAGLAALRDALAPGGAMHLMVYAPYGRTGIYMVQDLCRRIGVAPGNDEVSDLVAALRALPAAHPLTTLLREAPDFRNEAALADALLHPQDRAYSVPELFGLLDAGGLAFTRWVRQAAYSPHCGVMQRLPQYPRIARLPPREQYAAAELFRGTMVRHSLIAHLADEPGVDFSGDAWPRYVPIRLPDTIAVEERLPPGAAAVLINRAHTDKDLFLPVDAREKRLFEAIDGERTVAEIARAEGPVGAVGPFFARLYRHDQIVLDSSR